MKLLNIAVHPTPKAPLAAIRECLEFFASEIPPKIIIGFEKDFRKNLLVRGAVKAAIKCKKTKPSGVLVVAFPAENEEQGKELTHALNYLSEEMGCEALIEFATMYQQDGKFKDKIKKYA